MNTKRSLLLFLIILVTKFAIGQDGPRIVVKPEVVDYGTRANGSDGTSHFHIFNTGDEPLKIETIYTAHGGMIAKFENGKVLPGDSIEVILKFDTRRIGPFSTSATVVSNAVNDPAKWVKIKGRILEP